MSSSESLDSPRYNPVRQFAKRVLTGLLPKSMFIVHGPATSKRVCLTFDDGPHPELTPQILDTLKQFNAKATFFVIGERAEEYPDILKRILAEGHTLASHTQHHVDLSKAGFGITRGECMESKEVLVRAGAKVRYLRPPWGKMSPLTLPAAAASKMAVALWSMDSMDYQQIPASQVIERIRSLQPAPGDILLFHDDRAHTAQALPEVLAYLKTRGLQCVTLETLMDRK